MDTVYFVFVSGEFFAYIFEGSWKHFSKTHRGLLSSDSCEVYVAEIQEVS